MNFHASKAMFPLDPAFGVGGGGGAGGGEVGGIEWGGGL